MVNESNVYVWLNLGGGNFGMLGLTLSLEAYDVLSPTVLSAQPHLGAAPIFPHGATIPQISNICVFSEEEAVYQRFNIVV